MPSLKKAAGVLLLTGVVIGLSACGAKPYSYHSNTESPKGPGLFTGDAGELSNQPEDKVQED